MKVRLDGRMLAVSSLGSYDSDHARIYSNGGRFIFITNMNIYHNPAAVPV